MDTNPHTFGAQNFEEASLSTAARILFPEIGGMKNRGRTQNGTCNWKMKKSFVFMKLRERGKLTACMTSDFGGHRPPLQRNADSKITDWQRATANCIVAARSAFCGAGRFLSN